MYDSNCTSDDGSIESPNLTENEFKYAEILSEIAKIAVFVSLRNSKFRVEAPDGMNIMMSKIQADGKTFDIMSVEEKLEYENKYLYENHSTQRLGNQGSIIQQILYEAHTDPEIQNIMKSCFNDIKYNASRATTRYMDSKNNVNLK